MTDLEHRIKISEQFARDFNETVGNLHLKDNINCDHCKNKGLIQLVNEYGHTYTIDCKHCKLKRKVYKTIKESGLDNLFKRYTLDSYSENYKDGGSWQSKVKQRALEYVDENYKDGYWFTILGQSGSGKTHLATGISERMINKGLDFEWLTFTSRLPYLYKELNSGFVDVKERAEKELERIKTVKVLYIDDLFKGKYDETLLTTMFDILNYRYYNNELITIISSEMVLDDLNNLDQAIAGRIKERSKEGYYLINLVGSDKNMRLKE